MSVTNTTTISKTINPNNAYLVRSEVKLWSSSTNQFQSWSGLTTMAVGFYTDALGTQSIPGLVGLGMSEVNNSGVYYVIVPAANTAILGTTYNGSTIYQVVTGGPSNEIKVVTPLRVTQPRYAQPGA